MYDLTLLLVVAIAVICSFLLGFIVTPGERSIREHNCFLKGKKIGYKKGYQDGYMEGFNYAQQGFLEGNKDGEESNGISESE